MICYASTTSTRRNLLQLHCHGWRLLFSTAEARRFRPGWRYGLDNGAWSAHTTGIPWDEEAFVEGVVRFGAGADWVVAPDVVGGGHASLDLSVSWLPWMLRRCRRVLVAVQDGVVPEDVRSLRHARVGVAIGGSTEWKEAQLADRRWAGCGWLHVLRANTSRRIQAARLAGADSFDGSGPSRFSSIVPRLTNAARQEVLWAS